MNILIIEEIHKILVNKLSSASHICTEKLGISDEELCSIIGNYDGLVIRSRLINQQILSKAHSIKFIGRCGSGLENIDTDFCKKNNIICINSPEGNRNAVAEHSVGMLLYLCNKFYKSTNEVKQGIWDRKSNWGTELEGKVVGIIGYGNTGSSFAKKLSGFNLEILAYDKYKSGFANEFVKETDMQEICEKADIFSVNLPLTEETKFLINNDFLQKFKKNIYFINTARGKIIKTSDLVQNIKNGKILGAGLDVIEYEGVNFEQIANKNADFEYLLNSDKVIITPHIAGWSNESFYKISDIIAEKIISLNLS